MEVSGFEPPTSAVRRPFRGVSGPGRTGPIGLLNCGFGPQRIAAFLGVSQRDAGRMRDEIGDGRLSCSQLASLSLPGFSGTVATAFLA